MTIYKIEDLIKREKAIEKNQEAINLLESWVEDKDIWQAFEEIQAQYPDLDREVEPVLKKMEKDPDTLIYSEADQKGKMQTWVVTDERLMCTRANMPEYVPIDDLEFKTLLGSNRNSFLKKLLIWIFLFALIYFLFSCATAKADEIVKVHLVHVSGVDSASTVEAREVFKLTRREYKNRLGVRLKRVSFRSIQNPYPSLNYLDQRATQFDAMSPEVLNIQKNKGEIVYFFMPPLIEGEKRFKSGRANKRCGIDYWNTYAVGWHKQNDVERSVGLMMHELGHTLSADHVDDDSVMSSYLPAGTNRYFSSFSFNQIKGCVE